MNLIDVFADTSGFAQLLDTSESLHHQAIAIRSKILQRGGRFITTNYIVAELVSLLHRPLRKPRHEIIALVEALKVSAKIEIVHITPTLDEAAWQLLKDRPDKEWSLVDCASLVLMQERGLQESLTTDHHFEQAGFVRLLRHTTP